MSSVYLCIILFVQVSFSLEKPNTSLSYNDPLLDCDESNSLLNNSLSTHKSSIINLQIVHDLFFTNILTYGIEYQVYLTFNMADVKSEVNLSISSFANFNNTLVAFGSFLNGDRKCSNSINLNNINRTFEKVVWTTRGNITTASNKTIPIIFKIHFQFGIGKNLVLYICNNSMQLGCDLKMHGNKKLELSSMSLPASNCAIQFPIPSNQFGLIIELKRLNIPCQNKTKTLDFGYIKFDDREEICGKLEQLSNSKKQIFYPQNANITTVSMKTLGSPFFELNYKIVDFCYNITFKGPNGSFTIHFGNWTKLLCSFRVFVPYGFKINFTLKSFNSILNSSINMCLIHEISIRFWNGNLTTNICEQKSFFLESKQLYHFSSNLNKAIIWFEVKEKIKTQHKTDVIKIEYSTTADFNIVKNCEFGWISNGDTCIKVFDQISKLSWDESEQKCQENNGSLAKILNEKTQLLLNKLLDNNSENEDFNAYWIGASDKIQEHDFRWISGTEITYSNWFSGWKEFNNFNKQPNDDGISDEDCVEIRKDFPTHSGDLKTTDSYLWNDRNCLTLNYFICEKQMKKSVKANDEQLNCNRSILLTRFQSNMILTSLDFPRKYPNNVQCSINISTTNGFRLIFDFDEFELENESTCSYDYLQIIENKDTPQKKLCGNWSSKLKLLRYISKTSFVIVNFVSDYSNRFNGYKIHVSIENVSHCSDERFKKLNEYCYLFVSYPTVSWDTAKKICDGIHAKLTTLETTEEQEFFTNNIRKNVKSPINTMYWLDFCEKNKSGECRKIETEETNSLNISELSNDRIKICPAIEWVEESSSHVSKNVLSKTTLKCSGSAGYICKKQNYLYENANLDLTDLITNQTEGILYSPNYPDNYFNNLKLNITIKAKEYSRIFLKFQFVDIEYQKLCLYDYLVISENEEDLSKRICGSLNEGEISNLNFVSESNQVTLEFRSDYSINKQGFLAEWKSIDFSNCLQQTITATDEGTVASVNFPFFLLDDLNCSTTILAPLEKRVWLKIIEYDSNKDFLEVFLDDEDSFMVPSNPSSKYLTFLSHANRMKVTQHIKRNTTGKGFFARYKLVNLNSTKVYDTIQLNSQDINNIMLRPLNYLSKKPTKNLEYILRILAPQSYNIFLHFFNVNFGYEICSKSSDRIEVFDNYATSNGTVWYICDVDKTHIENSKTFPTTSMTIKSHYNSLLFKQSMYERKAKTNIVLNLNFDEKYKQKLVNNVDRNFVETCDPNPCLNNGKCYQNKTQYLCQCRKTFTGLFCDLTLCDLKPCVSGKCVLVESTNTGFKCNCDYGFTGKLCDLKKQPCDDNPCENRGLCIIKGSGYFCQCHAWWEGERCQKRILHIPYKSLSERMFREPFWLGLITVFIVMIFIGFIWCARKHFPEKLEKLLAEEADRNRTNNYTLRSTILNDNRSTSFPGQSNTSVTNAAGKRVEELNEPSPKTKSSNSHRKIFKQLLKPVEPKAKTESLHELSAQKIAKKKLNSDERLEKKVTFSKLINKVTSERTFDLSGNVELSELQLRSEPKPLSMNAIQSPIKTSSSLSNCSLASDQTSLSFNDFLKKNIQKARRKSLKTSSVDSVLIEMQKSNTRYSNSNDGLDNNSLLSGTLTSVSFASTRSESSQTLKNSGNTIEVSVTNSANNVLNPPTIFLENQKINEDANNKDNVYHLSPIREIPTPLSTPLTRSNQSFSVDDLQLDDENSDDKISIDFPNFSVNYSDGENEFRGDNNVSETLSDENSLTSQNESFKISKLDSMKRGKNTEPNKNSRISTNLLINSVVPELVIQEPSPTQKHAPKNIFSEQKTPLEVPSINIGSITPSTEFSLTKSSEVDAIRKDSIISTNSQSGMCLLNPFQRPDRISSESNLSSSGYSSMASPGSSRCNSNNPLCDIDDNVLGIKNKKHSPLLKSPIIPENDQPFLEEDNQKNLSESSLSDFTDNFHSNQKQIYTEESDITYEHSSSEYQKIKVHDLIHKFDKIPQNTYLHRKTERRKHFKKSLSPKKNYTNPVSIRSKTDERITKKPSPRKKSKHLFPSSSSSESLSLSSQTCPASLESSK